MIALLATLLLGSADLDRPGRESLSAKCAGVAAAHAGDDDVTRRSAVYVELVAAAGGLSVADRLWLRGVVERACSAHDRRRDVRRPAYYPVSYGGSVYSVWANSPDEAVASFSASLAWVPAPSPPLLSRAPVTYTSGSS